MDRVASSMIDRAIMTRIGTSLLMEIINAAAYAQPFYRQLGIDEWAFDQLVRMNARELRNIADSGAFSVSVDTRVLNSAIQNILNNRDEQTLVEDAIRLGASRVLLRNYAGLSFQKFADLSEELGIDEQLHGRPPMLSDIELSNLADLHARYAQLQPIKSKKDHLRCLVYLAKHSNLDIKRIYNYFYLDNITLYQQHDGDAGV